MRTREFGELECLVLKAVQTLGRASVAQVQEYLGNTNSYTTILTVMARLAKKGELTREKEGRQYVYQTASLQVSYSLLQRLKDKLFGGKASAMVCHFLKEEELSESEWEEIGRWIESKRAERKDHD